MTQRPVLGVVTALALLAAACGSSDAGPGQDDPPTPEVMAAAVEQLITVDHTFGGGPPPFSHYVLVETTEPTAGTGADDPDDPRRGLTADERDAIEEVVAAHGSFEWTDAAAEHQTDDLRPTREAAVIIGIGSPHFSDDSIALVPVSLWCGGLCGTWITYRVEIVDGAWTVVGTEGPIAIS